MLPRAPEDSNPLLSQLHFQFSAQLPAQVSPGRLSAIRYPWGSRFLRTPFPKHTSLIDRPLQLLVKSPSREVLILSKGTSLDHPKDPTLPPLDPQVNLKDMLLCQVVLTPLDTFFYYC